MYDGDQGPLTITRTATVNGLAPSSASPLRDEFSSLKPLDPTKLVPRAQDFLAQMGVNKSSQLGTNPCMILLGEPRRVERRGTQLAVWKILNGEIPSWGRLTTGPGDHKQFTKDSTGEGLYTGDPENGNPAVYVQSLASGQSFLDDITAAVIDDGIIFNTHSPGWAASVYHEILHTFESKDSLLNGSFFFREGFVEWFATQFMVGCFGVKLPYYPPYQLAAQNIEKVIRFTSVQDCAKAYFADDKSAASKLVPLFYQPIIDNQLEAELKLHPLCVKDAMENCGFLKAATGRFAMQKGKDEAAWYKRWVQEHGLPEGGLQLQEA